MLKKQIQVSNCPFSVQRQENCKDRLVCLTRGEPICVEISSGSTVDEMLRRMQE